MNTRANNRRRSFSIEGLEGRIAPSGGLAEHPGKHHAHAEVRRQERPGDDAPHGHRAATVQAARAGADDRANHDAGDDHGAGKHGRDDGPNHR